MEISRNSISVEDDFKFLTGRTIPTPDQPFWSKHKLAILGLFGVGLFVALGKFV